MYASFMSFIRLLYGSQLISPWYKKNMAVCVTQTHSKEEMYVGEAHGHIYWKVFCLEKLAWWGLVAPQVGSTSAWESEELVRRGEAGSVKNNQWCKVTKYIYLSTVLKYSFELFVLYLSISNFQYFYFYSTTSWIQILYFYSTTIIWKL